MAGAGGIRAGQAFVELMAKDAGLASALDAAQARMRKFGSSIGKLGLGMIAVGTGLVTPIVAAFAGAISRGSDFDVLARQVGGSTEELSSMAYALERVGLEFDDFAATVKKSNKVVAEALDGNEEANKTLFKLGTTAQQVSKMSATERFKYLGELIANVADVSERGAIAQALFGKAGEKALRLFANGGKELAQFLAEAEEVGAVVTGEQAAQAREISNAWSKATSSLKYAFFSIGQALLPNAELIKELADQFSNAAQTVRAWIKENAGIVYGVLALGTTILTAGAALTGFGLAISTIATGLIAVKAAIVASGLLVLKGLVIAVAIPFAALSSVIAGVVVAFAAWPVWVAAAVAGMGALAMTIPDVASGVKAIGQALASAAAWLWDAGKAAFKFAIGLSPLYQFFTKTSTGSGLLSDAIQILGEGFGWVGAQASALAGKIGTYLASARDAIVTEFGSAWGTVKATALESWGGISNALKRGDLASAGQIAWAGLQVVFAQGILTFQTLFGDFWDFLNSGWDQASESINLAWNGMAESVRETFTAIAREILGRLANVATYAENVMLIALRTKDFATGDLTAIARGRTADRTASDELRRLQKELPGPGTAHADREAADEATLARTKDRATEREADRNDRLGAGESALDAAKSALQELLSGEEWEKAWEDAAKSSAKMPGLDKVGSQMQALAQSTKGMFQGDFSASLSIGDAIAERQLTKLGDIDDKLGQLIDKTEGGFVAG